MPVFTCHKNHVGYNGEGFVYPAPLTTKLDEQEVAIIVNFPSSEQLSHLGEFGLIRRIAGRIAADDSVVTGIGDDAAVTALTPGMQLLTSTDMLLEDVHFRRVWHDPYRLGRKSLAVSISDIAAMGAIPRWALLSLALPSGLSLDFVDRFMEGFLSMAAEQGVSLTGGDTCSSKTGLVISVTIMGEQFPERIIRRSGACVDDDIWVTGTLGDAALALQVTEKGGDTSLVSRLLDPTPRVSAALELARFGYATALIDVSDGVLADFGHIAELSAVGGQLFVEELPLSQQLRAEAAVITANPYQLALSGGEDYELCFTAPPANREKIRESMKKCGVEVTRIGIVTPPTGVFALNGDGSRFTCLAAGFNHFN